MTRNTCNKCRHWTQDNYELEHSIGSCGMTIDSNDIRVDAQYPADRAISWDFEAYGSGVYTGPNFGCIHFAREESK